MEHEIRSPALCKQHELIFSKHYPPSNYTTLLMPFAFKIDLDGGKKKGKNCLKIKVSGLWSDTRQFIHMACYRAVHYKKTILLRKLGTLKPILTAELFLGIK